MSREKQIEIIGLKKTLCVKPCDICSHYSKKSQCIPAYTANRLYEAGYRKQSEGEWIAKDNFIGRCTIAICSNCGTEKAFPVLVRIETISTLYPYCQKCGAKMKGGAE